MGEETLKTIKEISEELNIPRLTIHRWIKSERLKRYTVPGRKNGLYSLEEAEKLKR